MRARTLSLVEGLAARGVKTGDKIAILSNSRVEWTLADFAIIISGAITVPIYQSTVAEQVQFILNDSDSSGLFVEDRKQLGKVLGMAAFLPKLKWIVVFDAPKAVTAREAPIPVYRFKDFLASTTDRAEALLAHNKAHINGDEEMSYVYTSGTTGNPKGVILSHNNFLSNSQNTPQIMGLSPRQESLLFLPLSHIIARLFQFVHLQVGFVQSYAESIDHLFTNIQEIRPHFMVCVPRIFEKVHEKIISDIHHANPAKKALFSWALEVGREARKLKPRHFRRRLPGVLLIEERLAHYLVHRKVQQKLGGRFRFFVSGGAPLSQDIAEFFYAFGLLILEGYGLTETTAPVALNRPDRFKFGTVGPTVPGCEVKIAEDGEILVKGEMVFKGYFKNPEATEQAFQGNYFRTGDIGQLDSEGFLKITDRKKDIIVTAGGKNIAPQNIENRMKTIPMVSQFIVHGDKRKFLSALVVLDKEALQQFLAKHKITGSNGKEPWDLPEVHRYVKQEIEKKNKELASYETIKKFAIIGKEFTIEGGELTPTLKVKRRVIESRYQDILDHFYHDTHDANHDA